MFGLGESDNSVKTDEVFGFIILFAKHYIYQRKNNMSLPRVDIFQKQLQLRYRQTDRQEQGETDRQTSRQGQGERDRQAGRQGERDRQAGRWRQTDRQAGGDRQTGSQGQGETDRGRERQTDRQGQGETDRQAGRQRETDRQAGRQGEADRQAGAGRDRQAGRQGETDRQTGRERETDRQAGAGRDRQTDRQGETVRQTDRGRERHTVGKWEDVRELENFKHNDSNVGSVWIYLTASPCYTTNRDRHDYTTHIITDISTNKRLINEIPQSSNKYAETSELNFFHGHTCIQHSNF